MNRPINTCLLGVGLAGLTFHVPFILALPHLFNLYAVLERTPKSEGGKVKDRFGHSPKIYRSLEDVLADKEIELVVVGTPNDTHYDFAKAALSAGKHGIQLQVSYRCATHSYTLQCLWINPLRQHLSKQESSTR